MANSSKLVYVFSKSDNTSMTLSFAHANPEVDVSAVQTLGTTIVANGSIYSSVPVALKSVKLVQTTETPYNI